MFRFILWALLFYFGWRIISAFMRMKNRTTTEDDRSVNFQHLEEADFEDITEDSEKKRPETGEPPPPGGAG